ncbi:CCA tRNA nucleotidyltransferase [Chitinivibrio alkaliphilus]|uniref:tRNA nucleotidyltransferase/poly(A) polymerase n=1 Tax=Chitinivibrio alkaliphilus ACht1 TaxID=1313304 RepID=U7D8X0_9BACT|nr:CCA tRNA nucleotidyltransferase [Chitinivibrio alkaliphilus]ERP30840.1 tRNA nucleotidyltransferase/poly(A) polymerase [Chitinivibrio alkaliphilus ACht1]
MRENNQYTMAKEIVATLQNCGYIAYFAGGCVRDMLRGQREFNDIDIATSARPDQVRAVFKRVVPVGESFGVMLVLCGKTSFEVATFRRDSSYSDGRHPDHVYFSTPQEDARRRDFTINGMYYDPLTDEIHDYIGGQKDLEKQRISTIGDAKERFAEDYLRMLRAVRFAARFSYTIDAATRDAITLLAQNITRVSAERIFQELDKMMRGPTPDIALALLDELGLLQYVLPEVAAMKGVAQPEEFHPEGDVFAHTKQVLSFLPTHPSSSLAWAALLHDVGKPPTQTFEDRIRFSGHNTVGARMAEKILRRLRGSNKLCDEVVAMIDNHMNFMHVQQMRKGKIKRFLSRPTIEEEIVLHRADCLASHGDTDNCRFLRSIQEEFREEDLRPEPLLRGKDLIALGLSPSPRFGKLLSAVYELQLEEEVETREEALAWVKKISPKRMVCIGERT